MRKKSEIQAGERMLFDQLWYARHMILAMPEGTPEEVIQRAEAKARQIEAVYHPDHLEDIQHDEYEVGKLHGMLMAVRWVLGMDWDDPGILDS